MTVTALNKVSLPDTEVTGLWDSFSTEGGSRTSFAIC